MGFTPGDFVAKYNWEGEMVTQPVHWELKDGPRIVLWAWAESGKILEVSLEQAQYMKDQLETLILMCEE